MKISILQSLAYFVLTFSTAFLTTPLIRRIALRYHVVAQQNHRTVHEGEVPKLGGGAIFLAFAIGILAILLTDSSLIYGHHPQILSLVIGAFVLFVMGTFDDKLDLDCNLKLTIEILAAILVAYYGWRVDSVTILAGQEINLGFLSYPITVLWIVGVLNAINMIDGLDGQASGIAIFISLISLAVALMFGNVLIAILSLLMLGSVAGFLRYNLNPASIFLGDSGSLSLGFVLACLSIGASSISPGRIAAIVPLLLLGVPLTDTTLAIIRRVRRGIHPFHADQEHIHHRLVRLGLSQSGAAMFVVGISLIFGILAYLVAHGLHTDLELLNTMSHLQ